MTEYCGSPPDEIILMPGDPEVISKGENEPSPRLISRIPDSERKPRVRTEFPRNLALGIPCEPTRAR